jgi:hypothetical protein
MAAGGAAQLLTLNWFSLFGLNYRSDFLSQTAMDRN